MKDTISWDSNYLKLGEIENCTFNKELFKKSILVFSYSKVHSNENSSGLDNAYRDIFYFVDIKSNKVLNLKLDESIALTHFVDWLREGSYKYAISDINFEEKQLTLINGDSKTSIYPLEEYRESTLKCEK